jgi:hypothetical protein
VLVGCRGDLGCSVPMKYPTLVNCAPPSWYLYRALFLYSLHRIRCCPHVCISWFPVVSGWKNDKDFSAASLYSVYDNRFFIACATFITFASSS